MSVERSELNVERSAPRGAVFISYAHEDAPAALRIADALRAFGVEVWFDQNELRGGDSWDVKIRTQIKTCTLFLPLVSQRTQERTEGYFRREWKLAVDRTHDMAPGLAFIVPVVIDDTAEAEAAVPEEFMKFQWTRLADGEPSPEFVTQVKRLLETPKKPSLKTGQPRPPTLPPEFRTAAKAQKTENRGQMSEGRKSGLPGWTWGALTAVVVGVAGVAFLWLRHPAADSPPIQRLEAAATVKPLPELPRDKSVAVLPFTNMSEEKDSAFFTDGMHEDILTNLALVRELRVVSRTSVLSYRGTTKPMKQIAQELGVTYILEGSVRRSGNKVRVTAQLIHAASDEHVWAQNYDRDLVDVFTIQSELSQQIAGAMKAALSPEEKILIARRPTENPAAYDLFLRARDALARENNTRAARGKQIELLQRAVELDPNFAQAWGELAATRAYWAFINWEGMEEQLQQAKIAIDRAMQLAPDDPEVYGSLGTYYYYGFRDYARAAEQYERRAKLQPNSPVVFNSLALILRRQGHWAQSLANARRAAELDPANIAYLRNLRATQIAGRRWEEVAVTQGRIVTLTPGDLAEAYYLAAMPFYVNGSKRETEAFFSGLSRQQLDSPEGITLRKNWARSMGDSVEAVRLDKIQPYNDENGTPHAAQALNAAYDYLSLGDRAGAVARLGGFPAELRARAALEPRSARNWADLAAMEALLGHKEEALRCIERCIEILPESRDALDGANMAVARVFVYDVLGEREKALAEYARLLRTPNVVSLNVHEMKAGFSTLRGDPRFEALLADPRNNAPLF